MSRKVSDLPIDSVLPDISGLSALDFIDDSRDDRFSFGTGNQISGEEEHATMTLGMENTAISGGIAVGFWSSARGEDTIAIGCGAKAGDGTVGWKNNVAIGRHAAVVGRGSVQLLRAKPTDEERLERPGTDYGILSADNTFRFGDTVLVSGGKIPLSSVDQAELSTFVRRIVASMLP